MTTEIFSHWKALAESLADKGTIQALKDASDRAEAAESERDALRRQCEEMREVAADKARLDFLDACNAALNGRYGTNYGWSLVLTHNVTRLMLGRWMEVAQKGLRDAQKYFGDAAVDALEDLIVNGAKAEDVVKRLAASLAKAALQAALMGSGPLAGLFGTGGTNGNVGGLFGALFGRAAGGPVNAGQPYRVGERGPETFVPTSPGKIVPNGRLAGAPVSVTFAIDARGATADAIAGLRAEMAQQQAALPGIILRTQSEARRRGAR